MEEVCLLKSIVQQVLTGLRKETLPTLTCSHRYIQVNMHYRSFSKLG